MTIEVLLLKDEVLAALRACQVAASKDKSQIISGVCLKVLPGQQIEFVGTDGNKLVMRRLPADFPEDYTSIMNDYIIANAEDLIKGMAFDKISKLVALIFSDNGELFFKPVSSGAYAAELICGQYLKYAQLIEGYQADEYTTPKKANPYYKISLNRKYLIDILRYMSKTKSQQVDFEFHELNTGAVHIENRYADGQIEFALIMPMLSR